MGAVRGALVGALSLIALEVVVTSAEQDRPWSLATLIEHIGGDGKANPGLVGHALSPNVALIPDRRTDAQKADNAKQHGIDVPLFPLPGIPLPGSPSLHFGNGLPSLHVPGLN